MIAIKISPGGPTAIHEMTRANPPAKNTASNAKNAPRRSAKSRDAQISATPNPRNNVA